MRVKNAPYWACRKTFGFDASWDAAASLQKEPTESYLVDPASSHTLVLKIKPCMSKCSVLLHTRLRTAHYNSYSLFDGFFSVDNRGNSRANTC